MTSQPDRPLRIELTITASQPELLEGLDVWLRLGLLNHAQVRRLSQTYLTCLLPEPAVVTSTPVPQVTAESTDWEVETPLVGTLKRSRLSLMWESLKDELSVRWLLFLGVFLVVVSSGVLAATQWRNFPAAGQYGVLWAYTVIFWVGSFWAGRQRNLQLTAQTLRLVSLLLVPVNFWAMDSFGLWRHPWQWMVVAIAAVTLSTITLLHEQLRDDSSRPRSQTRYRFAITSNASLLLGLSYLHWGWQGSGFPLVAVYLGMVGTAIFLPKHHALPQTLPQQQLTPDASRLTTEIANESLTAPARDIPPSIGSSIVVFALTVLLGRGIFVVELPIAQLGLAIGICGWLFARLGQSPETTRSSASSFQSRIWEGIGGGLLLIGWLVSVREIFPWQAAAVSGLGLLFCSRRLQRFWGRRELIAIFLIGLQAHWLIWRLVPLGWQQEAIAFLTQLTNSQSVPWALLSLALFPYLIGMVVLIDWLYRVSQLPLARFTEQLTFSFGLVLTLISLVNPTLRSLNLLLSTVTLASVTSRWTPSRTNLVYLTHVTGLLTLASAIDGLFPNLSQPVWAGILLVAMGVEWGFSLGSRLLPQSRQEATTEGLSIRPIWQRSAWHLGFVLSGLSYALLWNDTYPYGVIETARTHQSALLWLLTPLTLTGVASRTTQPRRQQASWLSIAALGMTQALTLVVPGTRLVSLGIATGLMWVNTRYLQQFVAAAITVGFGLSFVGMLLWEGVPGLPHLSVADWFLVGAIATFILWLLRSWLQQRSGTLAALYTQACDNWAVGLCGYQLLMLTFHGAGSYLGFVLPGWKYLAASALIGGAIIYRYWQQPNNSAVYSFSWAVEILIAQGILLAGGSTLKLAIANIILGLVTLFVSEWWLSRQHRGIPLSSIEILPLLYTLVGIGLRFGYFTRWTGLLTLGAALVGIGVGRRRSQWKPVTYLSLAGISVAWYELVIYQLIQAKGGSPADGLTILAGVAVAIAFAYHFLAWFWQVRTREPFLSLSVAEIKATAHIHWAIGSSLMVLAARVALETAPRLTGIGIVLSLLLAAYALVQGRQDSDVRTPYEWVYIGCIEVAATVVYARLIWTELNVLDAWFAIIACVLAYGMYELPWNSWGWPKTPWKRSAVLLPALTVCVTTEVVSDASLLLVAGFYAWIFKRSSNIRFSYISVGLIDWAIARWFDRLHLTDPLWYAALFGLSLLYLAQFDPGLKQPQQRQIRHYLRIFGSGGICLVALLFHQGTGLIPGMISTITIFAGLILRVRAFLFVGTATFLLTAFYQLVVLIARYPFFKWVVGLIVGIIFIGMAANFETRREQIASVFRNSRSELNVWE